MTVIGKNHPKKLYILDTNVLLHDPNALLNFEEHHVIIPMTVLEELDALKTSKQTIAAECRQAIRLIDKLLGDASPPDIEEGIPIRRDKQPPSGLLSILLTPLPSDTSPRLPDNLNDNKIINHLCHLQKKYPNKEAILITKDINMRLKARACGIRAEDYNTDQLLSDIDLLPTGYKKYNASFWDVIEKVDTQHENGNTFHRLQRKQLNDPVFVNQYLMDDQGFVGRVTQLDEQTITLLDLHQEPLMHQTAWGLKPRNIYQAVALNLLMDPDIHLVSLNGSAGSGKTILALAAAIDQCIDKKIYSRIITTRSTQGLDQDIGYLPGTEAEKMEPWLGAITDNLEALHADDESAGGSVDYILNKIPLHFKSLNYIRGRSFQQSFMIIDECQNLTPHQMKTILTRAGQGTKVVCLGNLAQIDTPYLSATSSGLTYMTERFKGFKHGGSIKLNGVPRSILAAYAEENL